MQQLLRRINEKKLNPISSKQTESSGYWTCLEAVDKPLTAQTVPQIKMPPPVIGKLNLGSLPKKEEEKKEVVAPIPKPNLGFNLEKMNAIQKVQ